jgi:hypothetical protein
MKSFINLVEAAGRDEASGTGAEALKPMTDYMQKMVEQNQRIVEGNQAMLDQLDSISRKLKGGTPVSQLMSSYPGIKLRRDNPQ